MEKKLQGELEELKSQLLAMSAKVERNIEDAVRTLIDGDLELARSIRTRDVEIDAAEIAIDEHCYTLLALQQPVARDLRFLATALKIVKDLERVGDMASNIADRAVLVLKGPPLAPLPDLLGMATAARNMLREALDAYLLRDPELARRVIAEDDEVDDLLERLFDELIGRMADDPSIIGSGIQLSYIIKYLERIGDHSSNIAEMVVFMVEGKDIRHRDKLKALQS